MKKIIISAIILLILIATPALAENWPFTRNSQPFTTLFTLSTGTATTGTTGTAQFLEMPFSTITCVMTQGTGTATTLIYDLEGSIDGTNYKLLKTITSTSWPDIQTTNAATAIPVLYTRATYSSRTGGLATVVPVLQCIASH